MNHVDVCQKTVLVGGLAVGERLKITIYLPKFYPHQKVSPPPLFTYRAAICLKTVLVGGFGSEGKVLCLNKFHFHFP
jgi:hypothetical protein